MLILKVKKLTVTFYVVDLVKKRCLDFSRNDTASHCDIIFEKIQGRMCLYYFKTFHPFVFHYYQT